MWPGRNTVISGTQNFLNREMAWYNMGQVSTRDGPISMTPVLLRIFMAGFALSQIAAAPLPSRYIVSGSRPESPWKFVLGPVPARASTTLRLDGEGAGGRFTFLCNKPGDATFAVVLLSPPAGLPDTITARISVGAVRHDLLLRRSRQDGTRGTYTAQGWAVAALLTAMGGVPANQPESIEAILSPSLFVSVDLPQPRQVAETAGRICTAWISSAHPQIIPRQKASP